MLHTASFYDPQDWKGQCYRVSRAHPRGRRTQWEVAPFLYPDRQLLQAYRRGDLDFAALSLEYKQGLDEAYSQSEQFQEWASSLAAWNRLRCCASRERGSPATGGWLLAGCWSGYKG